MGDDAAKSRGEVLVPLVKAWGTDAGVEVSGIGVQVHGGMGYIEETGAAQHWRDSKIDPIYEGTNGIQAADLVTRKLGLDGGDAMLALFGDIAREAAEEPNLAGLAQDCREIAEWMQGSASLDDRLAGSVPFTTMAAVAVAGWQLLRQLHSLSADDPRFIAKQATSRYFLDHVVPEARGLKAAATGGAGLLYSLSAEALAG